MAEGVSVEFAPAQYVLQEAASPVFDRMRTKWSAVIAAGTALAGVALAPLVEQQPAHASGAETAAVTATVGMPFDGQWAWNANVAPPYSDANSSHPSVHQAPGNGDWATDIYAATEGKPVKLHVQAAGKLSFRLAPSTTSCGQSVKVDTLVNGQGIGSLYIAHLSDAVTGGEITNGMTLGTLKTITKDGAVCNPGRHAHVELKNAAHHACYTGHGNPGVHLKEGTALGVLGSAGASAKKECAPAAEAGTGITGSRPAAVARGSGAMDVFFRDNANHLQNSGWTAAAGWNSPVRRATDVNSSPAAVSRGGNDMDVVYIDTQGRLMDLNWNPTDDWHGPFVRATGVVGDPAIISRSPNSLDIFARKLNGDLVNIGWNPAGGWGRAYVRVPGEAASNPVAIARGANAMDVFYRDKNGSLRNVGWSNGGGWNKPSTKVSGEVVGTPAAIARTATNMEVLYRDKDNAIKSLGWDPADGWTGPFVRTPSEAASDPIAMSRSPGDMSAFYRDVDGNLREVFWSPANSWQGPVTRAANVSGPPSVAARSATDLDVFYKNNDGSVGNAGWNPADGWMQNTLPGSGGVY